MTRPLPDEYTVTAEPIEDRDTRPSYTMNQAGSVSVKNPRGSVVQGGGVPDQDKKDEDKDE